ncbi:hypothetical protein E3N88_23567 [Mikania micrantha]|uniref:separase n=1 Tax=Mikania micrantha TaxID=192012 RepID=A0A5N6NDM0_9ASTR|nr:hypothetical protein E3N88_23567 [Mikania micrantha]
MSRMNADYEPLVTLLPIDKLAGSAEDVESLTANLYDSKTPDNRWHCPWGNSIDEIAPLFNTILEGNFRTSTIHATFEDTEKNFCLWFSQKRLLDSMLCRFLKVIPGLNRKLISVGQLDKQGMEVRFGSNEWKVVKGNLMIARGMKHGSLYLVDEPAEGCMTVPVKRNKIWFAKSRAKRVHFANVKSGAKEMLAERVQKSKPFKGFGDSGSKGCVPGTVTKSRWVLKTITEEVSPVGSLLCLESVGGPRCISGSSGVSIPVEIEDESLTGFVTTELELGGASIGPSCMEWKWDLKGGREVPEKWLKILGAAVLQKPEYPFGVLIQVRDAERQRTFEDQMLPWENLPVAVLRNRVGIQPSLDEVIQALKSHDLYIYIGHGSGQDISPMERFKNLIDVLLFSLWAAAVAFCCEFCKTLLTGLKEARLDTSRDCSRCTQLKEKNTSSEVIRIPGCKHKSEIWSMLSQACGACSLPYLMGAAPVCYGIPTVIRKKDS